MNVCTIFLITFLTVFSFNLTGVAPSSNKEVHNCLGYSVLLPAPSFTGTLSRIQWVKLTADKTKFIGRKTWNTSYVISEKYQILNNGSLRINNLMEEDAGNYKVDGHNNMKTALFHETTVTLTVHEPLPQPQLIENCSNKTLICQVESKASRKLKFELFQNNKVRTYQEPKYVNGIWKLILQQANLAGKFKCEVVSGPIKNETEKEINCLRTASHPFHLTYIMMIGGGVVILIIFMALIIYCVRKKRAERREIEDQERELQMALAADDELRRRKLPQPPVRAVPNQAHQQQQKLPLHHPELEKPSGPPQPCPRPPQRKPPRHMKERP